MIETDGILLCEKPKSWTSHDLVSFIRSRSKIASVGHSGTLDPLATGLMIVLLGEATKLSREITQEDKSYRVVVQLGLETDTWDLDGKILRQHEFSVSEDEVRAAGLALRGEMELSVPAFSAIKVAGEKLYEKARQGETFELPKRKMIFEDVRFVSFADGRATFDIHCSKGSYIRSWAVALGSKLGVATAVAELTRERSGKYRLDEALMFSELEVAIQERRWTRGFIPLSHTLPTWKSVRVRGKDEVFIRNGQIAHGLRTQLIACFDPDVDEGVKIISNDEPARLLALIKLERNKGFIVQRVFRYDEKSINPLEG